MRFLADIPDDEVRWLDKFAHEQGKSRAAVLREAVTAYRRHTSETGIEAFFGLWQDRGDITNSVDFQRKLNAEWDRDWDAKSE